MLIHDYLKTIVKEFGAGPVLAAVADTAGDEGIRVSAEKNQKDYYHKERDGLHKMYLIVDEHHCYSVRSNDDGQYLVEYSTFLGDEDWGLFNNVTSRSAPRCDLAIASPFFFAIEKLAAML